MLISFYFILFYFIFYPTILGGRNYKVDIQTDTLIFLLLGVVLVITDRLKASTPRTVLVLVWGDSTARVGFNFTFLFSYFVMFSFVFSSF